MQKMAGGSSIADRLRDARFALRSAMYDAALELLEGCEDWNAETAEPAIVLKAETILRRDPVAAISYLTMVGDIPSSSEGLFAYALQFGKSSATVRDFTSAESRYAEARPLADSVRDGAHSMAAHELRLRWFRRECDPTTPEAALAVSHPDPSVASAAFSHRAWMYALLGRYDEHIADLRSAVAFATMPLDEPVDAAIVAASAHALAQVSFETANAAGVAAAAAAADAIAWTPDIRTHHFLTTRALGWDAFLRGRSGQAQWAFKDARALAPSHAWRVMSHLDRAYVARMARNEVWAIEELAEADRLARDVRWEANFDEARQVLVMLAVLHAPVDAVRAQRYAATYAQLGTDSVNPSLGVDGDRRVLAHAKYAQGRIDQTLGRRDAAIVSLTEAYDIFSGASYFYRAALAAAALAELTGEAVWRDKAVSHARHYPDCPLTSLVDEAVAREEAMPRQLTPLQQQIARALWSGAETEELSRRFSRSIYTIEQQIVRVYEAFAVTSRGGLLEEARRRGLA